MNYNPDCFGRLNEKQFSFPLPHPQTKEQTSEQLQQHSISNNALLVKVQSCIAGRHNRLSFGVTIMYHRASWRGRTFHTASLIKLWHHHWSTNSWHLSDWCLGNQTIRPLIASDTSLSRTIDPYTHRMFDVATHCSLSCHNWPFCSINCETTTTNALVTNVPDKHPSAAVTASKSILSCCCSTRPTLVTPDSTSHSRWESPSWSLALSQTAVAIHHSIVISSTEVNNLFSPRSVIQLDHSLHSLPSTMTIRW